MNLWNVDWEGAQAGFATVFNLPSDVKYAQRIMFHMDPNTFTPVNDNAFNVCSLTDFFKVMQITVHSTLYLAIQIKAADGSYFEEFEITNRGTNCVELKSHITMADGMEVFLVPFTGVEQDANGIVSYIIGV